MSNDNPDDSRHPTGDDQAPGLHERILETVGDPVCTFDTGGQFGYVNAAFERQTGYDAEAVRDEPLTLVMNDEDAQTLLAAIEGLRDADRTRETVEITLHPRDSGGIPVECNLTMLDGGQPRADVVAAIRDITARKAREERLSKFASVVSHDLRNPLDVALGRAEILPEIADVDEENEQHLNEIYNSLKRMEQLIQDVLTLSRQNEGTVETEPVDLAAVAREAWGNVETTEATLTVTDVTAIAAHRGRLLRLFENLFRNSVEHGDDGIAVEIGMVGRDQETGFYVADDGPGIDEDDREQLFEGGYSTSDDGTGLGLTIVREIAKAHNWHVNVADADDCPLNGARFEITGVAPAPDSSG
jgi:PAS domain S-box-containing protein